jgi:hypothetical protein
MLDGMDTQDKTKSQFYRAYETWDPLREAAERVLHEGIHITGALYSATESSRAIFTWLRKKKDGRHNRFEIKGGEFPCVIYHPPASTHDASEHPSIVLWMEAEHHLVYMLSCQRRDLFEQTRLAVYRFLQPDLCKVYLRTGEIEKALTRVTEEHSQLEVRVKEYTARSLIDDPNSQKRVRTNREWTDEEHTTVFGKLREEKQWLGGLRLQVRGENTSIGRIWRDATFSCESGFTLFFNTIIKGVARGVAESREFFDQRAALSSPTGFSRPVKITYEESIFADKKQNRRLQHTLVRLKDSSLSVYHPNPYFHASLVDYADGSSYELWVTNPTSILVVPKRKATADSMERVCNFICDEFQEGDVQELPA